MNNKKAMKWNWSRALEYSSYSCTVWHIRIRKKKKDFFIESCWVYRSRFSELSVFWRPIQVQDKTKVQAQEESDFWNLDSYSILARPVEIQDKKNQSCFHCLKKGHYIPEFRLLKNNKEEKGSANEANVIEEIVTMVSDMCIYLYDPRSSYDHDCNPMLDLSKFTSNKKISDEIASLAYNQVCSQSLWKWKDRKIKILRSERGGEYFLDEFSTLVWNMELETETQLFIHLNKMVWLKEKIKLL